MVDKSKSRNDRGGYCFHSCDLRALLRVDYVAMELADARNFQIAGHRILAGRRAIGSLAHPIKQRIFRQGGRPTMPKDAN